MRKKLDMKLREAADAMQSHMLLYKAVHEANWQNEIKRNELNKTLDVQGREVARTISKRIRDRISPAFIGVNVRCTSTVDHRNYTVKPYLHIVISGQCRRINASDKIEPFGSFEASWTLNDPSVYKIETVIDMAVATAKLISAT